MRLAAVVIALLLIAAAPAGAASVTMTTRENCIPASNCWTFHRILFEAAAGEVNDVTVTREGTDYRFADAGAPLTAAGECRTVDEHTALCPVPQSLEALIVRLGDGADHARATANASVDAGAGDDVLEGGTTDGGPGNDVITGDGTHRGGDGDDRITGGQSVAGGSGDDVIELTGRGGADPGPGRDVVLGSPGDDHLTDSDEDRDRIEGRGGYDVLSYENRPRMVIVDLSPAARVPGDDDLTGVEHVVGTPGTDVLQGDEGPNSFDGGGGEDQIYGRGGADTLLGGPDADTLSAGDGDDRIVTHEDFFADRVDCGDGHDTGAADRGDRRTGCEALRLSPPPVAYLYAQRLRDGRVRLRYACAYGWPSCSGISDIRARGRRIARVRFGAVGGAGSSLRSEKFRARGTVVVRTVLDPGRGAGVLPFEQRLRLPGRARRTAPDR